MDPDGQENSEGVSLVLAHFYKGERITLPFVIG